ncbi:hypothetical protein L6164_023456 [Bauhinia variegata]|nr:hypothetical protein L6164_023456 [Bauhinia variegata]
MAAVIPATQNKIRWGELEEDDREDLDFLLPPRQVIGPDENGIKKVIEYKFDEDGNKVKITTTTRTRKLANARLSKHALEKRSWAKFGDAVHEDVDSRLTMVSIEEILLERPRPPAVILPSLQWLNSSLEKLEISKEGQSSVEGPVKRIEGDGRFSNADLEREDECGICLEPCTKMVLPNCCHAMCIKCYRKW